jgi:predicted metal-dependent peptidase
MTDFFYRLSILLAKKNPTLYFLSKHISFRIGEIEAIAATTGKEIIVRHDFLNLPLKAQLLIYMHELYHILFKHPIRSVELQKKGYPFTAVNIACDAKVNHFLRILMRPDPDVKHLVDTFNIPFEMLDKSSVEEIVEWLTSSDSGSDSKSGSESSDTGSVDLSGHKSDLLDPTSKLDTVPVYDGNPNITGATPEKFEEELDKAIRSSLLSGRMAGFKGYAEEILLEDVTRERINWFARLKSVLQSHIYKNVTQTYSKPNKRFADLPCKKMIGNPKIWAFVDVSGSIKNEELKRFVSILSSLQSHTEVDVVLWNVGVIDHFKLGKEQIKMSHGGGTVFLPAITKFSKEIKPYDVLVVLTDGYWFDKVEAEDYISNLRCKKVLLTVDKVVKGFNNTIKLEERKY